MKFLQYKLFIFLCFFAGLVIVYMYQYNLSDLTILTTKRKRLVAKRIGENVARETYGLFTLNGINNSSVRTNVPKYTEHNSSVSAYQRTSVVTEKRIPIKGKYAVKEPSFYRINTTLSDQIDVHRRISDGRPEACKKKALTYPETLPKASIIVIFRDEWPSVLIRTVYSLLNNTPADLLEEVVLVDHGSETDDMIIAVHEHFADTAGVKMITNPEPYGLMRARQVGIEATTSDYFVVMDSHLEFSEGWLEPLLARLVEYPNNLLTSHVGTIHSETFHVNFAKDPNNIFIAYDPLSFAELWAHYTIPFKRARNGSVDPVPVVAVQGMLIAMKKEAFFRLGGFDPGMRQWGAEQFELSIKTWMCGGRVENIPCSKVAHLYRLVQQNRERLIEVVRTCFPIDKHVI